MQAALDPSLVDGQGHIELAGVRDGKLELVGWVVPAKTSPLLGAQIEFAGQAYEEVTGEVDLPSPDLEQSLAFRFGMMDEVADKRFHLRVALHAQPQLASGANLVRMRPRFAAGEGPLLTAVLNQTLTLPGQSERELLRSIGVTGHDHEFTTMAFWGFGLMLQLAGLAPEDRMLDIGCGMGRMAYALVHYLERPGSYEGLDISAPLLDWAQAHVARQHSNFRFQRLDVKNLEYNTEGDLEGAGVRLPFADREFDLVFLTSVFTHMRSAEIRRYLEEIRRVLRPGGRCICTFYLIDSGELEGMRKDPERIPAIVVPFEDGYVLDPAVPEKVIGFPLALVSEWIRDAGLSVERFSKGLWCGPRPAASVRTYQDLFVLRRP